MLDTILVIDPDERRRDFARAVLDRAGYEVRAAADEGEAKRLCRAWRPAAVVAPAPPRNGLADLPLVTVPALDRADLLAAVWVALNP